MAADRLSPAQTRRLERLQRQHTYRPPGGRSHQTPSRSAEAREAERTWRDQLSARAGPDYDGRMKMPPPRQREAARFGGGYHARGTGGSYDWFYELDPAEQQRIRANWMTPRGFAPDELEDKMPMGEWLSVTRRIDMARAIAGGRRLERKRYGGLDPDQVLLSGRKLADLRRAGEKKTRRRPAEEGPSSRCHFFTDDDGVVHPIRSTCGHIKPMSRKEIREKYGDDEAF